jgi:hypothetical protein
MRARKLERRAPAPVVPAKPAIDLTLPNARKALAAAYPAPANDTIRAATPAEETAVVAYLTARDAATIATGQKDAAGNVICAAIGFDLGFAGDGFKATWNTKRGSASMDDVLDAIAATHGIERRAAHISTRMT